MAAKQLTVELRGTPIGHLETGTNPTLRYAPQYISASSAVALSLVV